MSNKNSLSRNLTTTTSIEIVPTKTYNELEGRVWAINWFNLKFKWLYNLYNILAGKYVNQVGGKLLFKGYNEQTLFGDEKLARKTLLIVTYTKIHNFLDMLTIKKFQLYSLLRIKAVEDFVFGFTNRTDKYEAVKTPPLKASLTYLIVHYQGAIEQETVRILAQEHGLKTYFTGERIAQVKRHIRGKTPVLAPFFIEGILVFEANSENLIDELINSTNFKAVMEPTETRYGAIFTRVK